MKTSNLLALFSLMLIMSCTDSQSGKDATGVFEATEVIVSAESAGKLMRLTVHEGQQLKKDEILGLIDTIQLSLQKMQLRANQLSLRASKPDVPSQVGAIEKEIEKLEFEKQRTQKLLEGDVATQKQLDDIQSQLDVLRARLKAQKKSLGSSVAAIDAQYEAMEVQMDQLNDQIARCQIKSPIDGSLLVKYAEQGEFVNLGKPLFKVANMEEMVLRAFVTVEQLKALQINQKVTVLAEFGAEETKEYEGEITWISDQSEFTPKTIQTQDERANLVYAIKVSLKNDGVLKIGMYGGLKWTAQ
jgi:HlyD family secretion protein